MDIRHIDEADSILSLDLLREWIGAAFRRGHAAVEPPGCPWGALVLAFQHAGLGGLCPEDTEQMLRRHLVDFYMRQNTTMVNSIIQAKMRLDGPFRQLMGDQDVEKAKVLWPWYLYCLTFAVAEPLEEGVARMPVDLVDLQVLASRFRVAITVSQLVEAAVRLVPPVTSPLYAIHLVHHRGLWAPLLGVRPPEKEALPLIDAVVELVGFSLSADAMGQGTGRCIGVVQSYNAEQDLYNVCLGDRGVLAERAQIKRVIYLSNVESYDSIDGIGRGWPQGERLQYGGVMPSQVDNAPLTGIPDASLEWQLLHELVRREARSKLEQMMQELSGRDIVDTRSKSGQRRVVEREAERAAEKQADFVDRTAKPPPEPQLVNATIPPADPIRAAGETCPENPQDASIRAAAPAEKLANGDVGDLLDKPDTDASPWYKDGSVRMRLPLDIMAKQLRDGSEFSVYSTADFVLCESGQLTLAVGDEIKVKHISTEWVLGMSVGLLGKPRKCAENIPPLAGDGWCPRDCLTVWEAKRKFRAEDHWERGRYLELDIGDTVVVSMRYKGDWDGWGFGERWGDKQGAGLFHLSYLEPQVLVGQWIWEI